VSQRECFLSTDIEADGLIPGRSSMLSFASVVFVPGQRTPVDQFTANLEVLPPPAAPDEGTTAWWATQPEAWAHCRVNPRPAAEVMPEYVAWLNAVRGNWGRPAFVGYPVAFDFMWVYWYVVAFGLKPGEKCPFGFQGLDLKTMAWERMGGRFQDAAKPRMPSRWFEGAPAHTHKAVDDATAQGVMFVNMLAERPDR
jgi:hypothetical protein